MSWMKYLRKKEKKPETTQGENCHYFKKRRTKENENDRTWQENEREE